MEVKVGNRRVVARTCRDCGRFMDAKHFNRNSAGYYDKVCSACRAAAARAKASYRRRAASYDARRHSQRQAASLHTASRYGQQWTSVDLDTVSRTDISLQEMAQILGRSYASIATMRHHALHPDETVGPR